MIFRGGIQWRVRAAVHVDPIKRPYTETWVGLIGTHILERANLLRTTWHKRLPKFIAWVSRTFTYNLHRRRFKMVSRVWLDEHRFHGHLYWAFFFSFKGYPQSWVGSGHRPYCNVTKTLFFRGRTFCIPEQRWGILFGDPIPLWPGIERIMLGYIA